MPDKPPAPAVKTTKSTAVSAVDEKTQIKDTQTSQTPQEKTPPDESLLKDLKLDEKIPSSMKSLPKNTIILAVLALVAGVATGFGGYKLQAKSGLGFSSSQDKAPLQQVAGDNVQAGDIFGVQDSKTFKDSAEGFLEEGGIDGEGSHKLLRPGGESQTVYLTSSVTDLDKLVGMQVKIHGETFKAQTAGWLMDVGRVEVVEVEGTAPSEE